MAFSILAKVPHPSGYYGNGSWEEPNVPPIGGYRGTGSGGKEQS